jgi:hypothetical protein
LSLIGFGTIQFRPVRKLRPCWLTPRVCALVGWFPHARGSVGTPGVGSVGGAPARSGGLGDRPGGPSSR